MKSPKFYERHFQYGRGEKVHARRNGVGCGMVEAHRKPNAPEAA